MKALSYGAIAWRALTEKRDAVRLALINVNDGRITGEIADVIIQAAKDGLKSWNDIWVDCE
jgi:hypothetical protein